MITILQTRELFCLKKFYPQSATFVFRSALYIPIDFICLKILFLANSFSKLMLNSSEINEYSLIQVVQTKKFYTENYSKVPADIRQKFS